MSLHRQRDLAIEQNGIRQKEAELQYTDCGICNILIPVLSQNGCQCIPADGTCVHSMSHEGDPNAPQQHYYGCQRNSLTHGPCPLNPKAHSCTRNLIQACRASMRQDMQELGSANFYVPTLAECTSESDRKILYKSTSALMRRLFPRLPPLLDDLAVYLANPFPRCGLLPRPLDPPLPPASTSLADFGLGD